MLLLLLLLLSVVPVRVPGGAGRIPDIHVGRMYGSGKLGPTYIWMPYIYIDAIYEYIQNVQIGLLESASVSPP